MKRVLFLSALVMSLVFPAVLGAETFDSSRQWMTLTTPHFFIRYAQESEYLAKKAAPILEQAWQDLRTRFNWKPWGRTEVVFLDSADIANGMASVIPYNWVLLYAAPPLPEQSLGYYDDWLRLLIYHEMTHIFHMDAARGWWKAFRFIFGKTVAPAGMVPTWVKEGEAVLVESVSTGTGRVRSSMTEMVLRTSMLEDSFPSISQGDGLQWTWPTYNIPYLYGGEFIEFLVDKYGFEKLMAFNDRTQRTLMLSMVNYAARTVYGKTFVQLWKEWRQHLETRYRREADRLGGQGLTETTPWVTVDPKWEEYVSAPTVSPDGTMIAYSIKSPHHSSEIRILDVDSGLSRTIVKKQQAVQLSWHPDGNRLIYSALSQSSKSDPKSETGEYSVMPKNYFEVGIQRNIYYDLWEYDIENAKLKRLTMGERARDPDYSRDGRRIVYISRDDNSNEFLKVYNVEEGTSDYLTRSSSSTSRFANPRYSPDGRWIVVSGWDPKNVWKIYRYSADGRSRMRLTKEKKGVELRPWWTPDGNHVLYSSDTSGVPNIYRVNVKDGRSEQLTNVLSGVFQPSTHDGRRIAVRYYTSNGWELHTFEARPRGRVSSLNGDSARRESPRGIPLEWSEPERVDLELTPKKYSPFGKSLFLPRFIVPAITYTEDEFFFALATGGSDALRWHNWMAGITYMTGANFVGYFARYFYNRWRPIMGFGAQRAVVNYGNRTFILNTGDPANPVIRDTRHYWERRSSLFGFVTYPWQQHAFTLSYAYEDRQPAVGLEDWQRQALTLGHFGGFTFTYAYGDTENYRAAISPENGRRIRVKTTWTNRRFGSSYGNEQVIFVGDWREYIRLWRHYVWALRASGGMTWGDTLTQGTFVMGGALGEGTLARQSSLNYFPLRGLPISSLGGTRAMLLSSEFRIPIVSPQRGLGTWPLYLQNIHTALFADFGDMWSADTKSDSISDFFDDFFLGVGAELRGDFVIGHGLPVKGRLGYGIIVLNRDRLGGLKDPILKHAAKWGVLILELGTSF